MGVLRDTVASQGAEKTETRTTTSGGVETTIIETEGEAVVCGHTEVEEYDIVSYEYEVVGVTEEIEITFEEETIDQADLPFSLCPGEFWADGIRTVYGSRHLVLGYANSFEVRETEKETREVGPMHNGMIIEVGPGECETIDEEQYFRVNLNVVDFKMLNTDSSVRIEQDTSREAYGCVMVAKNTHRILAKFAKFMSKLNWASLKAEYEASPEAFYKNYLEMFYPATISIYFNAVATLNFAGFSGLSGEHTLLNRRPIEISSEEVLSWPPSTFDFRFDIIEIMQMTSETTATIVTRIERFDSTFIFPFITEEQDVLAMQEHLNESKTLSDEYILKMVTKYVVQEVSHHFVVELPFSTEPAAFWREAVKTLYGDTHLLLGLTDSLKLRFEDDLGDAGSMLSGLSVKIGEAISHDVSGNPEFSLNLDIIDFKMVSKDTGIKVELDTTRDGNKCVITANNTNKIIKRFDRFTKRVTWNTLVAEFEQNPVRFYRKYLSLFYPCSVNLSFNIRKTIEGSVLDFPGFETERTLINRKVIEFTTSTITDFPPSHLKLTPNFNIDLVDHEKPTEVVIKVGKFENTFVTPKYTEASETTVIKETITTTLTYDFIREKVVKHVTTQLPFPNNPALFWREAIKTIYGNSHLLIGSSPSFVFDQTEEKDSNDIGTMHSGMVLELGDARIETMGDLDVIKIGLNLTDFKMVDSSGKVEIDNDTHRPKEESFLVLGHADEIIEWFSGFSKHLDYTPIIEEFFKSPVDFYKKHIHRFYPAVVQVGVNVKKQIEGELIGQNVQSVNFINRETILITSDEILNFPPSSTHFETQKPIEFVVKEKPSEPIITISSFETNVVNLTLDEEKDSTVIEEIEDVKENGLSFDFIRTKVTKYVVEDDHKHHKIQELPFETEPVKFFEQAIRSLYGEDHLLLGVTDSFKFKGPDGKSVDFGKMHNGLTYRLKETKTQTEDLCITFEIVDFKMISKDNKVKVVNDKSKPGEITMRIKNLSKVTEVFDGFKKPANWTILLEEYERNPKVFFKQNLETFFPGDITINFNMKTHQDEKVYVTKDSWEVTHEVTEFPPRNVVICPKKDAPIKLVDEYDSTVVVCIEDFDSKMTYPQDEMTGEYDMTLVHEVFEFDFTDDIVNQVVVEKIVSKNLPFSLDAGCFFADAITNIYGKDHVLLGITKNFKITDTNEKVMDIGTMLSGYTIRVSHGTSTESEISVNLDLVDFKLVSKKQPGVVVELDKERPAEGCYLRVPSNEVTGVITEFRKIFSHDKWESLISEYELGPKAFYIKYIELFFPAQLSFSFNTTTVIDSKVYKIYSVSDKPLVNKNSIVVVYDKLKQFPPSDIELNTVNQVELVVRDNPEVVVSTVSKLEIKVIYETFENEIDVNAWQKVIDLGITIDYIIKYTKKYVGSDVAVIKTTTDYVDLGAIETVFTFGVPFPLCPGEFWAEAIKHIYGKRFLLLGSSEKVVVGGKDIGGRLLNAIVIEIGEGNCYEEGNDLRLKFKVVDYKAVRQEPGTQLVLDRSRYNVTSFLVSRNEHQVMDKFNHFANPMNWKSLSKEYAKSPIQFYKKHVKAYYPASIHFGLHVKFSTWPTAHTKHTYISHHTVWFSSDDILSFPPSPLHLTPTKVVELVDRNTKKVMTTIDKFDAEFIHFTSDTKEIHEAIKVVIKSGLNWGFVREYVPKYYLHEPEKIVLPFPEKPDEFWFEAFKTILGEDHVMFGLTDKVNVVGPKGEGIEFGPFQYGLQIKIRKVKQTTNDEFKLVFDVVDYRGFNKNHGIEIVHDTTKVNEVTLTTTNVTKITDIFLKFQKLNSNTTLIDDFNADNVKFYQNYISYFYPATFKLTVGSKAIIKNETTAKMFGFDKPVTLHTKDTQTCIKTVHTFPANDIEFVPEKPMEFVDANQKVVVKVEKPHFTWVTPLKNDKYDIEYVKTIVNEGLNTNVIIRHVTHQIISKRLPFNLNIGQFFADAITTLHGSGTLLLGTSPQFHLTGPDGKVVQLGPMYNGVTIKIGKGYYEPGKDIKVQLDITDFKMINKNSDFQIDLDRKREDYSCFLVVDNTDKIIERFTKVVEEDSWDVLINEYNESPKKFYEKHIQLFYPCTINAKMNLTHTIDGESLKHLNLTGKQVFFNKETINITCKDIVQFPPLNLDLTPVEPVELVGIDTSRVVFTIKKFKTVWTRPQLKDEGDLVILNKHIHSGITFDYIRVTVPKYIVIEHDHDLVTKENLPFPICPGEFWEQAIRTVYGETHLVVGNTDVINLTDVSGNPVNDGPMYSGMTVKVQRGHCDTFQENQSIKVFFDIVDYKLTTKGEKIKIEHDHEREGNVCILEVQNTSTITTAFNKFANPGSWAQLTKEYNESPVEFYKKFIHIFYPSTFTLKFNLKHVKETVTVVNKKPIHVVSNKILNWPPSTFELHITEPVEFVEHTHRTVVVMKIEKFHTNMIHMKPSDKDEFEWTEKVLHGHLTFDFIYKVVINAITRENHKHDIPDLPFPLEPAEFWKTSFTTLFNEQNLYLSLTSDFKVTYTDNTTDDFGPLMSGVILKLSDATTVGEEFQLNFEIVDLKIVSTNSSLKAEVDKTVIPAKLTITTTNGKTVRELIKKFMTLPSWKPVVEEFNLSPKKFFMKHIAEFYPAEVNMTAHYKYVMNGTKTLVTKDVVTFSGKFTNVEEHDVTLTLKTPILLVQDRTSTDVVAKITGIEKKWVYPNVQDEVELKIVHEVISSGTLTYIFVQEKVTKYIISKHLPFPLCPGEFFAEAIKQVYPDGQFFVGITHHYKLTLDEGKEVDIGPMLSAITMRVDEGTTWNYTDNKSVRIRINILDFKMVRRDGGIEIEPEKNREQRQCYLAVNNTTEILSKFTEFFNETKWEELGNAYRQDTKAFYKKYLDLFFPATISFGGHCKFTVDGDIVKIPGIEGKKTFTTKTMTMFEYDQVTNFPLGDMRIKTKEPMELIEATNPEKVVLTINTVETVWIWPEIDEKSEMGAIQEVIVSGITFRTVYEMVSKYIVTNLPFSTDPGTFWADAMKAVYGEDHLLLGLAAKTNIHHANNAKFESGPILAGILTKIGKGKTVRDEDNQSVSVELSVQDMKMTNWDGAVEIGFDSSKQVGSGLLVTRNAQKVFDRFAKFADPSNWEELIGDFERNQKRFYKKQLKVFYPARIVYNLNVTGSVGAGKAKISGYKGAKELVSSESFSFVCEGAPCFPPPSFFLTPSTAVKLMDKETASSVGAIIARKKMVFIHPAIGGEKSEQEICLQSFDDFTFDYVRKTVPIYMDVPVYRKELKVHFDYVEL